MERIGQRGQIHKFRVTTIKRVGLMDTCRDVFEQIYRRICQLACLRLEVSRDERGTGYCSGVVTGLYDALLAVAVFYAC